MIKKITFLALVLTILGLLAGTAGCASDGGTSTVPVGTAGAQNVGGDQGVAQATESGSAVNHVTPVIVNAFAAKKVRIVMKGGSPEIDIVGNDEAAVEVEGATFGNVTLGDDGIQAEVSSGGGAAGAGGSSGSKQ